MNDISSEDIAAIVEPLTGELKEGKDLRTDISPTSSYQMLRDARKIARDHERLAVSKGESKYIDLADWKLILEKAPEVLKSESKDLEILAWYIEGLTRRDGFKGLAQGYSIASGLLQQYDESLYPRPDEDGISTLLAPLMGLNGYGGEGALTVPIKSILITQGASLDPLSIWQYEQILEIISIKNEEKRLSREEQTNLSESKLKQVMSETSDEFLYDLQSQIEFAIHEYEKFKIIVDEYESDEPLPTGNIKSLLEKCKQVFGYLTEHRLIKEADNDVADDEVNENELASPTAVGVSIPNQGIKDRKDALQQLSHIAKFFRDTEPHSPVSYAIEQAIRWSDMPLTDLINELIPDESARNKYKNLSGISLEIIE